MLTLYGHGGSQPSRAVWWTCLIKQLPFVMLDVRIDQFGPAGPLAKLNPTGQVPTIQDGDFVLYEMPAILGYLCDKHGWEDLYPRDLETRAYVNQYLHFHHNRTRHIMIELMAPHVVVAFLDYMKDRGIGELHERATHPEKLERGQAAVREIFRFIEGGYFRDGTTYLCANQPTIADIACYEEVAQLRWAGLFDFEEFPTLHRWLDAMARLPRHDTAHHYNITLGDIRTEPNTIERYLGANAAAAEALAEAGVEVRQLDA
jgi:glutathione S-transferase